MICPECRHSFASPIETEYRNLLAGYKSLAEANSKLNKALRKNIRMYRVDDQAWDSEEEVERIYRKDMGYE